MGTSSSGTGAKGKTPLLPSWATGGSAPPPKPPDKSSDNDGDDPEEKSDSEKEQAKSTPSKPEVTSDWAPAKTAFTRFARSGGTKGSFRNASNNYVRSLGGSAKATRSASRGIAIGGDYIEFIGSIRRQGLEQTLQEFGLTECLGKSTEEALSRIAQKISPSGTTNDEILARSAVMAAMDSLYSKLEEKDDGIESITEVSEDALKDTVVEYVSAYIFKKWIYELGLALERNDLSEQDAIGLENEVRNLVRDEVKTSLQGQNILTLDFQKGEGKRIIENIFNLAYSTLEK